MKNHFDAAFKAEVIADFHLGKDLLYGDLNIKDSRTKRIFGDLYKLCLEQTPPVALLIYLSATTDLLLERIRQRKRDFELEIDPGYYAGVNAAYETFFERYAGQKLRLPMDEWDFVQNPALFDELSLLVDRELKLP